MGQGHFGGMSAYLRGMCAVLARWGLEVHLFTRAHTMPHEPGASLPGVRLVHIPTPGGLWGGLHAFWEGVRHGGQRGYSLVHAHYWTSGLVGLRLAQEWGVPLVCTFHTTALAKRLFLDSHAEPPSRLRAERLLVRRASALTASSPHEVALLAEGYGADPHRIILAPPGVDPERFFPRERTPARHALGLPEGPLVLAVGRPDPIKRFPLLVEALTHMEEGHLVIAGEHDGLLRGMARRLGVEGRLRLLGPVAGESMPLLYAAADVVVVPSRYESFGMVALEGMACGRPVVAARVGGLTALVRHGETGYLVEGGCPRAYAFRLETLLTSPSLRRAMGERAALYARAFSWDTWAQRMVSWYRFLAGGERGARLLAPQTP
jgi:D-inositol-3-phosphate glycosyltransferase